MALPATVERMPFKDPLLTAEEVAARLNVTKDWVWDHSSRKTPYLLGYPDRCGFMDTDNYRYRVLKPLAEQLGIEKLNFQILRRTMATQAQKIG